MGFSLRKALGAIAPFTAAIPGIGPLVSTAITVGQAAFPGRESRALMRAAPSPTPVTFMESPDAGGGGGVVLAGGTAGGLMVAGTRVAAILAKVAARFGRRIAKWRIIDLIRKWGPFAAAGALGITADEAIELWLSAGPSRRRARGISAADLRRTGRVLGTLNRFNARVREFCGRGSFAPRRARVPAHGHRVTATRR